MSKYQPLTEHLNRYPASHYPIKFTEIEAIIGNKLPVSAFQYRAWWSNNPRNSVMTKAWLDAGWISSDVNLVEQKLVFRRRQNAPAKPRPIHGISRPTGNSGRIELTDLSADIMNNLAARATLEGCTVEQAANKILSENSRLTTAERLVLADRIRAASPRLHHIDVPAMIRQDRDSR